MLQKYNRYKLLKIFLENPTESFRLRELSRLSKIAPPSTMNYLKEFEKEDLIKTYTKRGIPFYQARRDNPNFIFAILEGFRQSDHQSRARVEPPSASTARHGGRGKRTAKQRVHGYSFIPLRDAR